MEKEFKSLAFEIKEMDQDEGIFEGYAAKFGNIDSYGDIIVPGAFVKTLFEDITDIKLMWNHDWQGVPIGTILELREDSVGLYFKAKLNNTSLAKDIKEALKEGSVRKMSIGYKTVESNYVTKDGVACRELQEIKLFEISPVNFPANDEASITGYKATDNLLVKVDELKAAIVEIKTILKLDDEAKMLQEIDRLIKKTGGNK